MFRVNVLLGAFPNRSRRLPVRAGGSRSGVAPVLVKKAAHRDIVAGLNAVSPPAQPEIFLNSESPSKLPFRAPCQQSFNPRFRHRCLLWLHIASHPTCDSQKRNPSRGPRRCPGVLNRICLVGQPLQINPIQLASPAVQGSRLGRHPIATKLAACQVRQARQVQRC